MKSPSAACKDSRLLDLWHRHHRPGSKMTIESVCLLAERFIRLGEPLFAFDLLSHRLKETQLLNDASKKNISAPAFLRLRQLLGFALARGGMTEQANSLLQDLFLEGDRSEETLGLLARTYKDLWLATSEPKLKKIHLANSHAHYYEGFRLNARAYWTGINAATTAFLFGLTDKAHELARNVISMCHDEITSLKPGDSNLYWVHATIGEAKLLLGDLPAAIGSYEVARTFLGDRWDDLASTRRNARLICEAGKIDESVFFDCFRLPPVVVFSGHMIDAPERLQPRFPGELAARAKKAIKQALKKHNPGFGYSSAACGGDIIFLESILELGGEIHIVLPGKLERFKELSVDRHPDFDWSGRFEKVMKRVGRSVAAAEDAIDGSPESYRYANLLFHGMARDHADRLGTQLRAFALWDGKPGDEPTAGTAGMVEFWQSRGIDVEIVNPQALDQGSYCLETSAGSGDTPKPPLSIWHKTVFADDGSKSLGNQMKPEIRAVLFADTVRFSHLKEEQISPFVDEFLAIISRLLERKTNQPLFKNTWGDGLFCVFEGADEAGRFALDLADQINAIAWESKGLPRDLNLRIALHAGPIIPFIDPVTGRANFLGNHVIHAARIEPITPPGQVFASQAFIALSACEETRNFSWEYVGRVPLAKSFGTFPLYHLRRSRP